MADDEGRPGYHDPTAGVGGAAPARSALTLRLVLAALGFLSCAVIAAALFWSDQFDLGVLASALAAIAVYDVVVVVRRKRRGEPG